MLQLHSLDIDRTITINLSSIVSFLKLLHQVYDHDGGHSGEMIL